MSQEQPRRHQGHGVQEPIKYGDVFQVSGELALKPVAPQDAAMMQSTEMVVMGQTQKGGPAATMQSAATHKERAGLVSHDDTTVVAGEESVTVTETDLPGRRIITESVGGQFVGQYIQPTPVVLQQETVMGEVQAKITIGEALEAATHTAGSKPVDQSDAAAIRAAEVRATGTNIVTPGGLASLAQSAASFNAALTKDDETVILTDALSLKGATLKLPADKPVTREDTEGVISAEMRNNPNKTTHSGGVAASLATAARVNEGVI